MLDAVAETTRLTFVKARTQALIGCSDAAIQMIDQQLSENHATSIDKIALLSLKAEIFHLNCRDDDAIDVFNQSLDRLIVDVPENVALSVGYNRSDVAFALFKPDDFYELGDRARVAEIELWRYEEYYHAIEYAKEGKHYDALPILWRELHRAYMQGCWRPMRMSHQHMARECALLGWLGKAAYHAIMSGDKDTLVDIGRALRLQGSVEQVTDAVKQSITWGQLSRHFVSACTLIKKTVDAIPDDLVSNVFDWVIARTTIVNDSLGNRSALTEAWQTLGLLGSRLTKIQGAKVVGSAIEHPSWNEVLEPPHVPVMRIEIIKTLCKLPAILDKTTIRRLAVDTLRLIRERKQDYDFRNAMQLLCEIATHGGNSTKAMLKRELYPPGKPLTAVELQVADVFGHAGNFSRLDEAADRIAANVRLQVQRLNEGEEAKRVDFTVFTVNATAADKSIVVSMVEVLDVAAIFKYRTKLSPGALRLVVEAILEAIRDPENVLANKYSLTQCLSMIGDVCTTALAKRVAKTLLPLARGIISEPSITMTSEEAANPLNRWKMPSGNPKEVQGISIYALACLERDKKGAVGNKVLNELIQTLAGDVDWNVRLLTFAAARESPLLDEVTRSTVMLGTRDRDGRVARIAFSAIGSNGRRVGATEWPMLLNAASAALTEPDPSVRCGAAETLNRLSKKLPKHFKRRAQELMSAYKSDRCWSVRNAAGRYRRSSLDLNNED